MTEDVKKTLIKYVGAVMITGIVALAVIMFFMPPGKKPTSEYYQEVDCGNGEKVYRIVSDKFNNKYEGRKLEMSAEIKDKLKTSLGARDIILQKADQSILNLRTSISGLLDAYNANPCSDAAGRNLEKIADYIVDYSLLSAKTTQINALVQSGTRADLEKAREIIAEQIKLSNSAVQKLKSN